MVISCMTSPSDRQDSLHSTRTAEEGKQSYHARSSRSLTPTRSSNGSASTTTPLVSEDVRRSAAKEAAQIGQWTRLQEHVVESVSTPKEETKDPFWLKAGLHMNTIRSNMFQIITEAAALGSMRCQRRKPIEIVTNDNSSKLEDDEWNENDETKEPNIKAQLSSMVASSITTNHDPTELVNTYVEVQRARKQGSIKDAEQFLDQIEKHEQLGEKWKTMELELPTSAVPRFRKPITYMTDGRLRSAVIQGAAEGGNARQERLVMQGVFKVHQTCKCIYCKNPTPFQTQSYQKLRMRQGWTDDSLEAEQAESEGLGGKMSNHRRRSSLLRSLSRRGHKKQTLAMLLASSTTPGQKKSDPDQNIPSLFRSNASSKYQVKAWKSRAAMNKRDSWSKDSDTQLSRPVALTPLGLWVSPRQRKEKLDMSSPKSGLPSSDSILDSPSTLKTKWDNTFVSPRTARNAKAKLPLSSASMHEGSSKPLWAEAKLRKSTIREPMKSPLNGSEEKKFSPPWLAGKDFLVPVSPNPRSPKPHKMNDVLTMTEHSPVRGKRTSMVSRTLSFDGEIDEEELWHQELDALSLASPLPSSTLQSPRRRTVKPALSPSVHAKESAAKFTSIGQVGRAGLHLGDDNDDDDSDDDGDDDFAY